MKLTTALSAIRRIRPLTGLMVILSALHTSASGEIIVAENFGGDGTGDLHATTADTFNGAITTAGGSSAWQAATTFKDDGSVTPVFFNNAYLSMGSYINDAKGTASGLFTLSTTLTLSTTGNWASIGFFRNPVTTDSDFTTLPGSRGLGTLIYRTSGQLSAFVGPGTTTGAINGATVTGPQLLTVVLDLTGHNNIDNFGSVSFYQGTVAGGTLIGSGNFAADYSFDAIGMSQSDYTGSYSGLQLEQIDITTSAPFQLTITPNASNPGNYDFEWNSQTGKVYDLVSATDLSTSPTTWPVWDAQSNIASGGVTTTLSNIPGGGDPKRFFVVVETSVGP